MIIKRNKNEILATKKIMLNEVICLIFRTRTLMPIQHPKIIYYSQKLVEIILNIPSRLMLSSKIYIKQKKSCSFRFYPYARSKCEVQSFQLLIAVSHISMYVIIFTLHVCLTFFYLDFTHHLYKIYSHNKNSR